MINFVCNLVCINYHPVNLVCNLLCINSLLVNLVCKNGKNESIPFSTFKEAEAFYHEIDSAIIDYNSQEIRKGL